MSPPSPSQNPGVPPVASLQSNSDPGIGIDGSDLIVPDGYVFPHICPLTGATTGLEPMVTRRKLVTASPLGIALLGGILATFIEKPTGHSFSFRPSPKATKRWRLYRRLGTCAFFASFYVFFKGASLSSIPFMVTSLLLFVIGLAVAVGLLDGLKVTNFRDGHLWISGIPRRVREKVVEIENARIAAAHRAAQAWAQQQALAQAQALGVAPAVMAPTQAGPPPVPLFFPAQRAR